MSIVFKQRFISGLTVFDTYSGLDGTIVQMNLDTLAQNSLSPSFQGAHFVVNFTNSSLQLFTTDGKRVDHFSGSTLSGVTLLTSLEKTALLGAGYPS